MAPARKINAAAIIDDWFEFDLTSAEVAGRHGTTAGVVRNIWLTAHRADLLLNIARPRADDIFAHCEASAEHNGIAAERADLDLDDDPTPCAIRVTSPFLDLNTGFLIMPRSDLLLAALKREHADDPQREHDHLDIDRFTDLPRRRHLAARAYALAILRQQEQQQRESAR